ncbi:hypothetical protein Tco_1015712 [Tanacetum coccineum]|uniref:DUF4371 domain-containing protein n=1 Tax=Tanacetum coccineum TaxID=301880 RepID=A0ABQ5FLM8_9ASTR
MGTNRTNISYIDVVTVFIHYRVHNLQKMSNIDPLVDDMDFALDIPTDGPAIVEMVNATKDNFDEDGLVKFQELLLDAEKPLYKGCPNFTKLSAIVQLLNLKGKISRFLVDNKTHKVYENILAKIHRHGIDEKFLEIAEDSKNLRLGISADGVDVNRGNRHHSVWLVLTVIYNLPPWLCMKRKFIMLSVLISGYPGNDINVFLELLVDDMHTLIETGVDTYDASTKENFNLRAIVLWTINDYPELDDIYHITMRSESKRRNLMDNKNFSWLQIQ